MTDDVNTRLDLIERKLGRIERAIEVEGGFDLGKHIKKLGEAVGIVFALVSRNGPTYQLHPEFAEKVLGIKQAQRPLIEVPQVKLSQ